MRKFVLTILILFNVGLSIAQTAEDINLKSKDLLSKQDFKNAIPLLKEAAEKGNAEAQYNYGICYLQGVQVPQNDSIANRWLLSSAKLGWKDAQFKIAYSYAVGRGIRKDDRQALNWSVQCAEQQDPECMFNVVQCYFQGRGTRKNVDSAVIWATRLALLPNTDDLQLSGYITSARANLASLYKVGGDVKKNLEKSYMWFLIYNENKRDFSVLDQQENISKIKEVEKQLSAADRTKAINEAERLLKRKLLNLNLLYKEDL